MPTVVPFPRKARSLAPRPSVGGQFSLVRLVLDLNATYDAVAETVRGDPLRTDQLRSATKTFMCDIARIGGPKT